MTLNPKHFIKKTILRPFEDFLHVESSGGILLLISTLIALVWANSPWSDFYSHFWETPFGFSVGSYSVSKSLHFWINDGLMAVFFFLVGLEIKREILAGELSSLKNCLLPVFSALGGMLVPALIYIGFNHNHPATFKGWGIPMATDIAFAIGVLALLGNRIPTSLKVFLTALAIVDDLGAVLVIAIFYTNQILWSYLLLGMFFIFIMILMNRFKVRHPLPYAIIGVGGAWLCFLLSGVHATVASVLAALTIPVKIRMNVDEFVHEGQQQLNLFKKHENLSILITPLQQSALHTLEGLTDRAKSPLQHLEDILHPLVSRVIMPLFALANAGIVIEKQFMTHLFTPATLGIICGLMIGKPIGITLFGWIGVKLGLASLPTDVRWKHIWGAGILAGMGFTMSIFIATLAFSQNALLENAKLGILLASFFAGILGGFFLLFVFRGKSSQK